MSQQLVPVDGGQEKQVTTLSTSSLDVLSPTYVSVNNLETRPTEWIVGGRPIYRRLPGMNDTYQINFFNITPPTESGLSFDVREIGYVFVPWGVGDDSPNTLRVVAAETKKALLVQSGNIVWKYGTNGALSTIIDLEEVDVVTGRYYLGYQLVYDDSPIQNLYAVEDFSLSGQPLSITSSADTVPGWRYPAVNAFLTSSAIWQNKDTFFPTYAQPVSSYLQWVSELTSAYSKITLRCPSSTAYTGTATLSYVMSTGNALVSTVPVSKDASGQFFEFNITEPSYQTGWFVEFSSLDVAVETVTVTGVITQVTLQTSPSTRCALVMYPANSVPSTVTNSVGKEIPATYCDLAIVEVGKSFNVLSVEDTRFIIRRDFAPVSDWLTRYFDDNLINLYEQVSDYNNLWLAPTSCMKQEYPTLITDQITVVV
jgi:hypothetical protein